jgi:uncharacterized protein (TIGR00369 family)
MDEIVENLTAMPRAAQNHCFGCGHENPAGLRLEFLLAADRSVVCLTAIPAAFEGPPGYLHGGIIATLLDEAMSKAVRSLGVTAMTRQMEIDYLHPVHSCASIRIEGRVIRGEGHKHWTEAKILRTDGSALAQSKGLFIEVRAR